MFSAKQIGDSLFNRDVVEIKQPGRCANTTSGPNPNGSYEDRAMAKKANPTPEQLRQLLRYDPETGELFWMERGIEWFGSVWRMDAWNKRCSGKEAFTSTHGERYKCGRVLDRLKLAHRVIWAIQTGAWPDGDVDHIDGDRANNAWSNLRSVSRSENMRNAKRFKSNTSGHVGVWWSSQVSKWMAEIKVDGEKLHIGSYDRIEDAAAARKAAEVQHGFHENHGRAT